MNQIAVSGLLTRVSAAPSFPSAPLVLEGAEGAGVTRALEQIVERNATIADSNRNDFVPLVLDLTRADLPTPCQQLMQARNDLLKAMENRLHPHFHERDFFLFDLAAALWWRLRGHTKPLSPKPHFGPGYQAPLFIARGLSGIYLMEFVDKLVPALKELPVIEWVVESTVDLGSNIAADIVGLFASSAAAKALARANKGSKPEEVEPLMVALFCEAVARIMVADGKPRTSKNTNPLYLILMVDGADITESGSDLGDALSAATHPALDKLGTSFGCHIIVAGRETLTSWRTKSANLVALQGLDPAGVDAVVPKPQYASVVKAIYSPVRPGPVHAAAFAAAWSKRETLPDTAELAWTSALALGNSKKSSADLASLVANPALTSQLLDTLVGSAGNIWFTKQTPLQLRPMMKYAVSLVPPAPPSPPAASSGGGP